MIETVVIASGFVVLFLIAATAFAWAMARIIWPHADQETQG